MKSSEIQVGDKVKGSNMFGVQYTVTEKFAKHCTIQCETGQVIMVGGKMVPEVFTYEKIKYASIMKVIK